MLINIILVFVALSGLCILIFYLGCMYKQYNKLNSSDVIELFPQEDIYVKNAYEGDEFQMTSEQKKDSERWAATQRGSVRIACGAYFTSDEYKKYKERVLSTKLP